MKYAEHAFQSAAYAFLRRALPADALVWSTDHAGKRSIAAGARMKQRGIIPGISDMFVFWRGMLVALELKAGRNSATEAQDVFGSAITDNGGHYYVVNSLEMIECVLRDVGFELRATTLTAVERDARLAAPKAPRKPAKPRAVKPSVSRVRRVQAIMDGLHAREPLFTGVKR